MNRINKIKMIRKEKDVNNRNRFKIYLNRYDNKISNNNNTKTINKFNLIKLIIKNLTHPTSINQ